MIDRAAVRSSVRWAAIAGWMALCAGSCLAQKPPTGTVTSSGNQSGTRQTSGTPASSSSGSGSIFDQVQSPFSDTSRQRRNDERQRRLVNDTQKLLALTAQLKASVAASTTETMTPEMLKQIEEIEKLAKSVKDKMRD